MNTNKKTIEDIAVKDKRVLVRVDFNVPMSDGRVTDETRIVAALPTIKYLADQGAKVILCSHCGRPKGEFNMKYSLRPAVERLSQLIGKPVALAEDVVGDSAKAAVEKLNSGDICMLENTRFHKEEEKNDPDFAKKLADFADIYVNDAFGAAHRAHASTAGVADYLPAVSGYLIGKELKVMGGALEDPKRPFVAILGGAKVSDKIGVINNLLDKVNTLLIGGGMAYTFLKAQGHTIGKSLLEEDKLDLAKELLAKAEKMNVKLMLPVDHIAGKDFSNDTERKTFDSADIEDGWMAMDIGPATQKQYADVVASAGTVIWNGPMGVFEMENFAAGTKSIAQALADNPGCVSIVGGGDSAAAVEQLGYADKVTHISTGGGASLEFLEGKELPGVACLNDK